MSQLGFFDLANRYRHLSKTGDPLEKINEVVDFEQFRPLLIKHLALKSNALKGGRPPLDPVVVFKVLILQSMYQLSDDQIEYQINDRLSFMGFLGLGVNNKVPDAKTVWLYRERLKRKNVLDNLFMSFDQCLTQSGYLAMCGQIVDASVIKAPAQRLTKEEKIQIKEGKKAQEIWDNANKAAQKDTYARWRVKYTKAKDEHKRDLGIPEYGYKNHISIDRKYGFIRRYAVSDAASFDGHYLPQVIDRGNTSSTVWADSAYQTQDNTEWLAAHGYVNQIHRRKPKKKAMPKHHARGNRTRSGIRARVEHVFAKMKQGKHILVQTIGLARAWVKIGLMNLAYNIKRLVYHHTRSTNRIPRAE